MGLFKRLFCFRRFLLAILIFTAASAQAQVSDSKIIGVLRAAIVDGEGFQNSHVYYKLEEFSPLRGQGKTYHLNFASNPPDHVTSGSLVQVSGKISGNEIYANSGTSTSSLQVLQQATLAVSGVQTTIVIPVNIIGHNEPCSVSTLNNAVFSTTSLSNNTFYNDSAFGQISWQGIVTNPVNLNVSEPTSCSDSTIESWNSLAEQAATAAGYNLSNYMHYVFVYPQLSCYPYAGASFVGGNPSTSWIMGNYCGNQYDYPHELGHAIGFYHASTPGSEYGDTSDVMGSGPAPYVQQNNGPHKTQLGWLPSSNVVTVSASGTYTLANIEQAGAMMPQALKIYRPSHSNYFYLSYRTPTGIFSDNLTGDLPLKFQYTTSVHLYPIDSTTCSGVGGGNTCLLSTLADGYQYSDSVDGITVKQISHTTTTTTVSVTMTGPSPSPSLSPSPSPSPTPADTTPPTAPANLTATLGSYLSGHGHNKASSPDVTLSWTASTDNVGVAGYRIFRNGTLYATTASTGFTDKSVSAGTSYTYYVKAYDAAGNVSLASTSVSVTVQ